MADVIGAGKVVGFHYTLTNDAGEVLDASSGRGPLEYLHGAGNIVPGLEQALDGHAVGESMNVVVEPEDGYGTHDAELVHRVPRAQVPEGVEVGMQLGMRTPDGHAVPVWVTAIDDEAVTIDMNHPLAGTRLHFAVEIASMRDASAEETAHGHPHGPGGHHH